MKSDQVVVVGAGVMGCAIALVLARRGVPVRVLERSVPGAEASSAAAGVLGAQVESHAEGPFVDLCLRSRALFAAWSAELARITGIDIEHRVCGITKVALDVDEASRIEEHAAWQRREGLRVELLSAEGARAREPALSDLVRMAALYPDDARVDPPRYLRALRIAAERQGAIFSQGALVRRVVIDGGRAHGVEIEGGVTVTGRATVIAAGSWSNLVPGVPIAGDVLRPARGQIIELDARMPPLSGVVFGERAYLSPRDDGRVLVGSTLEFVGFERAVTAGAVRDLLAGAIGLVPALARVEVVRMWSQLRPHTKSELPMIGRSGTEGLLLATGHFRNGILLSPITAECVAARILGEAPPVELAPFESPRVPSEHA